jgi:hypothetical protein
MMISGVRRVLFLTFMLAMVASVVWAQGEGNSPYKVLEPMTGGNLQIFPVVSTVEYPPGVYLTLAEGLATGDVVIMERGKWEEIQKLRTPGVLAPPTKAESPQVGKLVLVNKTRKPLMMLGGEVLTGGKQDRVVGNDRLVPANSGAVDLDVFCVEPHRWKGLSEKFGGAGFLLQPSVRLTTISTQNQRQVWNAVGEAQKSAAGAVGAEKLGSSSYAAVMDHQGVRAKMGEVTGPIGQQYEVRKADLKFRNMVGVVVAIDGRPVWADVFATTDMLEQYWPKLLMSYAAEAVTRQRASGSRSSGVQAEEFLRGMDQVKEQSSRKSDLSEQVTMCGGGYRATEVRSRDEGYVLHTALMVDEKGKCK